MSKKPPGSVSKLKEVVEANKQKNHKTSLTLMVDAKLLTEGKKVFGRQMGAIFEAALQDALDLKKGKKEGA